MENSKVSTELKKVAAPIDLTRICIQDFDKLVILLFYADFDEGSKTLVQIFEKYAKLYPDGRFAVVDAAATATTVAKQFEVDVVPTVVFTNGNKDVLKKITDINPSELLKTIEEQLAAFKINFETEKTRWFAKLEKMLNENKLIIFIKGTPDEPKCGFTREMLDIMHKCELKFNYFDILSDESLRNWLRFYAKWNTYPQVWINGKIVGGLDVTKKLLSEGKFLEMVPAELKSTTTPQEKLEKLLQRGKVLLLVKGLPSKWAELPAEELAKDESKKQTVDIVKTMQEKNADFFYYNMEPDPVTYDYVKGKGDVQFYVNKELIGGPAEMKTYMEKNDLFAPAASKN